MLGQNRTGLLSARVPSRFWPSPLAESTSPSCVPKAGVVPNGAASGGSLARETRTRNCEFGSVRGPAEVELRANPRGPGGGPLVNGLALLGPGDAEFLHLP